MNPRYWTDQRDAEIYDLPLGRYFPPLPRTFFHQWAVQQDLQNHLLIDPISAHPYISIELAAHGFPMLASRNNPINWLITEVIASAPSEQDFNNALNPLLNTRFGDGFLADHLASIYETACASCGKRIQAKAFVWRKDENLPFKKIYHCPFCKDEGEYDLTSEDIERIHSLGDLGMHRSRAIQRVSSENAIAQETLRDAVDSYLPRALYVCMLLMNRVERLAMEKRQKKLLLASLLPVFDDANMLWPYPEKENAILKITPPGVFLENNLWLSLTNAYTKYASPHPMIPVKYWPNFTLERGEICFFQRKLIKKMGARLPEHHIAVPTLLPKPNPAYWTYSALWSGWVWGKKAIAPMMSALVRKRYDWYWFNQAIKASFSHLSETIPETTQLLGAFPNYTLPLVYGLCAGLRECGMQFIHTAYNHEQAIFQFLAMKHEPHLQGDFDDEIGSTAQQFLLNRGEPADYHQIVMDAIQRKATRGSFPQPNDGSMESSWGDFQRALKYQLSKNDSFDTISSSFSGKIYYWPMRDDEKQPPISERMENIIREQLNQHTEMSFTEIMDAIDRELPDKALQGTELIKIIASCYAIPISEKPLVYRLNAYEMIQERENDIVEMKDLIRRVGKKLGCTVKDQAAIQWVNQEGSVIFNFFFTSTAMIKELVENNSGAETLEKGIVFPASRSRLIVYRLRRDPQLASLIENHWHLLKYRHVRNMAAQPTVSLTRWMDAANNDPPLWDAPTQLPII